MYCQNCNNYLSILGTFVALRTIVYLHITDCNWFLLSMQLWDWEGSVSIFISQQSVRPVSKLGEAGSLGNIMWGPSATTLSLLCPHHKGNPSLEAEKGYDISYPDPKYGGMKDQDLEVHCRTHFFSYLELARKTKSFGSLNAVDFSKFDFKCTYEPRLKDKSVLLNCSQIWS